MKRTLPLVLVLILVLGLCMPAAAAGKTDLELAVERVEQGIRDWQTEVDLRDLNVYWDEVTTALKRFYLEPELFYFRNFTIWSSNLTGRVTKVELNYHEGFTRKDVDALNAAVDQVLTAVPSDADDLQKLLVLHDYLVLHTEYDAENYLAGTIPKASYTAYGALVLGKAVCEGYTMAYRLLLQICGIASESVTSAEMNHTWCLVQYQGKWYHVDVTWDDPMPDRIGQVMHNYFLQSDTGISDAEHGHYNWTAGQTCTDGRFDSNAFWSALDCPIIYTDADTLWLLREYGDYKDQSVSLVRRDWMSGEETVAVTVRDYWPVWESRAYWTDAYSGLCLWDRRLFFNDSLHIYSYDPADGAWVTEFTYDGHEGFLYGLSAQEDDLLGLVRQSPMDEDKVYTFTPERKYAVNPFQDVHTSDYFHDAVLWAYANNVTKGTSDTTFSPQNTCTRGQVVTFLWRAMGCPEPNTAKNPFGDVPEGEYYRDAVLWAVEKGITNGTGTDAATGKQVFSPNTECTYAQILTFLWRTVTGKTASSYGEWYSEPMDWAVKQELDKDTPLGTGVSGISAYCPRCDVVTFLCRAVG